MYGGAIASRCRFDERGNVLKDVRVDEIDGTIASIAPSYQGVGGVSNGWYKVGGYVANCWTDSLGGTKEVDLSKIDKASVTETISFYPLMDQTTLLPDITVARYNLSTTGAIQNIL